MPYKNKIIAAVMPAYNAEKTLKACYEALPKQWIDLVILVDDCSQDKTAEVARTLPVIVYRHEQNRGYGGNQKTCYRLAREHVADVAVMIHPDHQYDPKFIPDIIKLIVDEGNQAVFGSRMVIWRNALKGGMPIWKFVANITLTKISNLVLGTRLTEFHSGFRAYDCRVFDAIDIEKKSDDFVFDTQIIIQLVNKKIPIKEIPIPTRYFKEASQIGLRPSIRYGCSILYCLMLYILGKDF
jgi:glycosyltransferase involved in cell wall biosynthesis